MNTLAKILKTPGGKRLIFGGGLMVGLILFSWFAKHREAASQSAHRDETTAPPVSKLLAAEPAPATTPATNKPAKKYTGTDSSGFDAGFDAGFEPGTNGSTTMNSLRAKPKKENIISTNAEAAAEATGGSMNISLYDATAYYRDKAEKAEEQIVKYRALLNPEPGKDNRAGGGTAAEVLRQEKESSNSIPANWKPSPTALPFGTLVKCVLISDLQSGLKETPVIGLVEQGIGDIPKNTILHGTVASATRDRIIVNDTWTMVFPDKREAVIRAKTLTRDNPDGQDQYFGKDNLSFGLKGEVVDERDQNRLYALLMTALQTAMPLLQQQNTVSPNLYTPLGGTQAAVTPGNAALAGLGGVAQSEVQRVQKMMDELGVYVHVASGRQFYLYLQQSFEGSMAAPGLGTRFRGVGDGQPIGLNGAGDPPESPGRLLLSDADVRQADERQKQIKEDWEKRVAAERAEQDNLQADMEALREQALELLKKKEKNDE